MIELIVFGALLLYLLISIGVVLWTIHYARRNGKSARRWGWSIALVLYLIPFWDWLPTVATHQYYCAADGGFWIYKTLDQWKAENPGVMEMLVDNSPDKYPNWPTENWGNKKITSINQRFGLFYKSHLSDSEESEMFLHLWRWKTELIDKKTGEVLARDINFSTGNGFIGGEPELRLWLHSDGCINSRDNAINFSEFIKQLRGIKK